MQFERKSYVSGKPVVDTVEFISVANVRGTMNSMLGLDDRVYAFEERWYENGVIAFSLKDKSNKLILQIKTKV